MSRSGPFDAVMFGNENDRPYELKVDPASAATMAYVIGRLASEIRTPFGVNLLWDPVASIAVAAATGARFVREIFAGAYASDMGLWTPDAGAAMRYRDGSDDATSPSCSTFRPSLLIRSIGEAWPIEHAALSSHRSLTRSWSREQKGCRFQEFVGALAALCKRPRE